MMPDNKNVTLAFEWMHYMPLDSLVFFVFNSSRCVFSKLSYARCLCKSTVTLGIKFAICGFAPSVQSRPLHIVSSKLDHHVTYQCTCANGYGVEL